MKKIQLGVLALIALATGMSAFSSSVKTARANINNHAEAVFTYYVYITLTGVGHNNTRVVTFNPILCNNFSARDCKILTNTAAITTVGGLKLVAPGTFTILSHRP